MELLERIAEAARRQHEDADLPASLLDEILQVSEGSRRPACASELIETLLEQIEAFDSYAGTGCFGDAVSAAAIQATLNRIRANG